MHWCLSGSVKERSSYRCLCSLIGCLPFIWLILFLITLVIQIDLLKSIDTSQSVDFTSEMAKEVTYTQQAHHVLLFQLLNDAIEDTSGGRPLWCSLHDSNNSYTFWEASNPPNLPARSWHES